MLWKDPKDVESIMRTIDPSVIGAQRVTTKNTTRYINKDVTMHGISLHIKRIHTYKCKIITKRELKRDRERVSGRERER